MSDNKKQIVSLRMNTSDLRKIKDLAARLRVRESDVFRFAIRSTLRKLAPLHDVEAKGRDLISVLIEYGAELTSYFELDAFQLESLINGDIGDAGRRVDRADIELLAMAGLQESYVYMKLKELNVGGIGEPQGLVGLLKQYLFEKYAQHQEAAEH